MRKLTPKQREIQEREIAVLDAARRLLLRGGYHGLTMARIAESTDCSKATVYQHFGCKEEVIVALAALSVDKQRALVERAVMFRGRPRERMLAIGEATEIFARLHADDARIFQIMNGEAITQKVSEKSLWRLRSSALRTVDMMLGVIHDGVAKGDLCFADGGGAKDFVFHLWLLGEAAKASVTSWMPPVDLGVTHVFGSLVRSSTLLADAYGWRPLSTEWDYDATRERIFAEVFMRESRLIQERVQAQAPRSEAVR